MKSRWQSFDATIGLVGEALARRGDRGRWLAGRVIALAAPLLLQRVLLQRAGRGAALGLALARLLDTRGRTPSPRPPEPSLLQLLAEAGVDAFRRATRRRGRWGLRLEPGSRRPSSRRPSLHRRD